MTSDSALRRWRLVLGRYAEQELRWAPQTGDDWKLEGALDYLYGREYSRRGLARSKGGPGSLDPAQIQAVDWLQRIRKIFPRDVYERMQGQALERYQIKELLDDPQVLLGLEPNQALAKTLLSLRGRLRPETRDAVKAIIRKVVEEITRQLRTEFQNAFHGRRNRFRRSHLKSAQNFDWRTTIRENLKHFDQESRRLVIERPCFNSRVRRSLPWDVILCVDQSGSMFESVMYSAIVAGILSSLPAVRIRLVVFDTSVVDLSHLAQDPVEVLLTVQLGGGTDIGKAMRYCEQLITSPHRTVVALISDFCEGASMRQLLGCVQRMAEARVKLLGLAALDQDAQPTFDREAARRLSNQGMEVAALTPVHFAQWLGEVMT